MWIYILAFIMSILLIELFEHSAYSNGIRTKEGIKKRYLLLALSPIIFVFLFRWNVGVDSNYYYGSYPGIYSRILNGSVDEGLEPVFVLISEVCGYFDLSYFWWLFVFGVIYLYTAIKFIKTFSTKISLSILLFLLTDLYIFGFSAIRQALAISFVFLLYVELKNSAEKLLNTKIVLLAVLAVLSHTSAIFMLLIIFVSSKLKLNNKNFLFTIVIITILSPLTTKIIDWVMTISYYGIKYEGTVYEQTEFTISYFLVAFAFVCVILLFFPKIKRYDNMANFWMNHILFFYFFALNSAAIIQPYRTVVWFMPSLLVIVPNWINYMDNRKDKLIMSVLTIFPLIFMFCNMYILGNGAENYSDYMTVFQYWSE